MSIGLAQADQTSKDMGGQSAESLSPGVSSKDPSMSNPKEVPVGSKTIEGRVTKLDKKKEQIEIETTEGKKQDFKLDPNIRQEKIEQINDGDNVKLEVANRNGVMVATSIEKVS